MPVIYMILWSLVMILALGIWRLRDALSMLLVSLVTAVILFVAYALFVELSLAAGLDPYHVPATLDVYLTRGLAAWLALLVMPCGWLGPFVGLHLVQRFGLVRIESHSPG